MFSRCNFGLCSGDRLFGIGGKKQGEKFIPGECRDKGFNMSCVAETYSKWQLPRGHMHFDNKGTVVGTRHSGPKWKQHGFGPRYPKTLLPHEHVEFGKRPCW